METLTSWGTAALTVIAVLLVFAYMWYRYLKPQELNKLISEPNQDQFRAEFAEELTSFPVWEKKAPPPDPELPQKYNKDYLVLMARDPNWLYAYWEITATLQHNFVRKYGEANWHQSHPVLRVYDITGIDDFNGFNANHYRDIIINEDSSDWHFDVGAPDKTFCVDLGRILPDGTFILLLRSNRVNTPRANISDCIDEYWMPIEGVYPGKGTFRYGVSSPIFYEELPVNISSPEFNIRKQ
ncbi:DUF4912 domain-containing protein [Desulfofalx alkaliphila]|uniref:DUF4912 domain-containing protein n=1 Tax=Desulfofalx alkaliphila TaxID=105483 RepID=UPI0004E197E2|nr:DUF4912 domain-containing protein [Desulfofalx alkaliphila]